MKRSTKLISVLTAILAITIVTIGVLEANSPANVVNDTCCVYEVTYVTDDNTIFGPDTLAPGENYPIKVPTGETIVKIIVNGESYDANIPVGTCIDLDAAALCICADNGREFCHKDDQLWVLAD